MTPLCTKMVPFYMVESLLGRKVADEEHVTVMAYPALPTDDEPDRKAAVRDLIEDLDSMAASADHIPDDDTP